MTVTVLDSNDLPAILADAGVELEQPGAGAESAEKKPEANANRESPAGAKTQDDIDDEDDNGLTESQRAELTSKMQKAIGKKHRMQKEAEEFAAAQYSERRLAEERAQRLEQELAELRGAKTQPVQEVKTPEKPQRINFSSDSEYLDAMVQFGVDEALRKKAEEDARAAENVARQEMINAAGKRMARALELVPDYEEVTGAVDTIVPPAIANYMGKSEMIAELGYHFAKNPELLVSLAKLPPDEQLVKIGRIESTLTPFEPKAAQNDSKSSKEAPNGQAKPAPSADTDINLSKPRGNAAPVITPLNTGSSGTEKDSKDMNIRESIEDFSKRNRINLGIRKRH